MTKKIWSVALFLFCISLINGKFGKAGEVYSRGSGGIKDSTQIVDKSLICFNDKSIYSTCKDAYRLSLGGDLKVPSDHTDEFCNGPCLMETNLVLHCIENLIENFVFYNRATIQDVRETVQAGCGHGTDRGNFDVSEHIQNEESKSQRAYTPVIVMIICVFLAYIQLML